MYRKVEDYIGNKINHLTILEDRGVRDGIRRVLVRCDCPKQTAKEINFGSLFAKSPTKSCGCVKLKNIFNSKLRHGLSQSKEHKSWAKMKSRCYNPRDVRYHTHGGRGITVCDEWINSFDQFYADMGIRPEGRYSLDRIDNDRGYGPENCRWASDKEQANNTRNNRVITFNDMSKTLAQWSDYLKIPISALASRLGKHGWDIEKAFTTPVTGDGRFVPGDPRHKRRLKDDTSTSDE